MTDGKVIWHTTMSLDGFIAGPDDSMDWVFAEGLGPTEAGSAIIHTTGAVLAGRRWYDLSLTRENWEPYGGAWQGTIVVLTHEPPADRAKTAGGLPIVFHRGEVWDAVAAALEVAAGKDIVVFGATIGRACIEAGLIDEILIHVVPVLLGDGLRFYDSPGRTQPIRLRRTGLAAAGQLTDLRFTVSR